MKLIFFTVCLVIFLIVILPVLMAFGIRNIPGGIQPPLKDTKKIYGQYSYYQSFISPQDNLAGIGVSLKNPRLVNKNQNYFNLYNEKNEIIRKVTLKGENIADGELVKILFEPVSDSLDKKFTWSIASPDSTKDNGLEVFQTDKKASWSREFKINGQVSEDSLSYVTLHHPSSVMQILNSIVSQVGKNLIGDLIFSATLVVLVVGLLIFLYF